MSLGRSRLDTLLAEKLKIKRKDVRLLLAKQQVNVDGRRAKGVDLIIDKFSLITVDEMVVQDNPAHYIILNKPIGVVSATTDDIHQTVIDLLDYPFKDQLHIVGRLDLNSSGLLLLTNDSRFSQRLMHPQAKVSKTYQVTLAKPLTEDMIEAFAMGMYFEFEDITTQPAKLEIISEHVAQVTLTEGRYHQIKRMFGRFRNQVVALHRDAIGRLTLDETLKPGQSRELSAKELSFFAAKDN